MTDKPTQPNTPEALREKLAKMAGLIELPESVFLPVDSLIALLHKDREAVAIQWLDQQIAQMLKHVYPLDVFPRTSEEDKKRINELDAILHTSTHIGGIYHGLHILRREVRGLSARDDLDALP
jgi:hypothetical protein